MSAHIGTMTNVIEYPVKTSEWGKTLIGTLNPIIDRLDRWCKQECQLENLQHSEKMLKGNAAVFF